MARLSRPGCLWLNTKMIYPQTVTHPSTNWARCRATTLIETNALPLRQAAIKPTCMCVCVCAEVRDCVGRRSNRNAGLPWAARPVFASRWSRQHASGCVSVECEWSVTVCTVCALLVHSVIIISIIIITIICSAPTTCVIIVLIFYFFLEPAMMGWRPSGFQLPMANKYCCCIAQWMQVKQKIKIH